MLLYEATYHSERGDYRPGLEESQFCWFADEHANGIEQTLFKKSLETLRQAGMNLPEDNREAIHHVAYCNFVQSIMTYENRRSAPSDKQVEDSIEPFALILATLKPDVVVAFGTGRVRSHVIRYARARGISVSELPVRLEGTTFVNAQHPSGQFEYAKSVAMVRDGLKSMETQQ
jgi:hypothetical protein